MKKQTPSEKPLTALVHNGQTYPAVKGPHAALIQRTVAAVHEVALGELKTLLAGVLLLKLKAALGHGQFMTVRQQYFPPLSPDTFERWMNGAELFFENFPLPSTVDIEAEVILNAPESELPNAALEYRQTCFDFVRGKSFRGILAALNGRKAGGHRGENRRAVEQYIPRHLDKVTAMLTVRKRKPGTEDWFVCNYRNLTSEQKARIISAGTDSLSKWPHWLLVAMREKASLELKVSEPERLARHAL